MPQNRRMSRKSGRVSRKTSRRRSSRRRSRKSRRSTRRRSSGKLSNIKRRVRIFFKENKKPILILSTLLIAATGIAAKQYVNKQTNPKKIKEFQKNKEELKDKYTDVYGKPRTAHDKASQEALATNDALKIAHNKNLTVAKVAPQKPNPRQSAAAVQKFEKVQEQEKKEKQKGFSPLSPIAEATAQTVQRVIDVDAQKGVMLNQQNLNFANDVLSNPNISEENKGKVLDFTETQAKATNNNFNKKLAAGTAIVGGLGGGCIGAYCLMTVKAAEVAVTGKYYEAVGNAVVGLGTSPVFLNAVGTGVSFVAGFISDVRLKKNIVRVGKSKGFNLYNFEYKNGIKKGVYQGVMAQEVEKINPRAVLTNARGYKMVNYDMIGLKMKKLIRPGCFSEI